MPIHIAARTSTEDQSLGIEAQEAECRAFALEHGLEVTNVWIDRGVSRTVVPAERPAMSEMLSALKRGDTVIVHKYDRIGDSVAIALLARELKRKRCNLLIVHGDNSGSDESLLLAGILSVISDHELRTVSSRTRKALRQKKDRGEVYTRRVYGFRAVGSRLVEDIDEQQVINQIRIEAQAGLAWAAIARNLNQARVPAPSGRDWHPRSVQRIAERQSAA